MCKSCFRAVENIRSVAVGAGEMLHEQSKAKHYFFRVMPGRGGNRFYEVVLVFLFPLLFLCVPASHICHHDRNKQEPSFANNQVMWLQ